MVRGDLILKQVENNERNHDLQSVHVHFGFNKTIQIQPTQPTHCSVKIKHVVP